MTGEEIKYLIAVLNSRIVSWYMPNIANSVGEALSWGKSYVQRIPIPKITKRQQRPIVELVDKILATKEKDPDADISQEKSKIDHLVYSLYDLTPAEIAIIETPS